MAFSSFIPEIWSARLLEHLDKAHVYAGLLNRDYEGEIKAYGDTVHINQVKDVTIKDYTGADIDDPEELDSNSQTLTIDQAKYFNIQIKDIDNAQSHPKLMDEAMRRAAYGISDGVDIYVAGLLAAGADAGNCITAADVAAANAYEYLVDIGTVLTEANVPMQGRWTVVPPWFHALLLKDDRFVSSGASHNEAVLAGGEVGMAAGFRILLSNNVPNTGGAEYKIIAGTNRAGSFAEQLVELEPYRREKNFADAVKGLNVFGAKVLQGKGLAVLTATRADSA